MADIAQLGFAVDPSGLVAGEKALEKLPAAAQRAEAAADSVSQSLSRAAAAAQGLSSAGQGTARTMAAAAGGISGAATASFQLSAAQKAATVTINAANGAIATQITGTNNLVKAVNAAGAAHKQNAANTNNASAATKQLSNDAKNLSFQLVDVVQGVLSGQRPFQIFAQQAGQIGQVLATTKGGAGSLFGEIGSALARMLTPMRLVTAGLIGITAGAVYAINSIVNSSRAMDNLAVSTDQATSRLRGLQQSMQKKGITPEEFASGFKSFSDEVYNAQRNMGSLNGLMIANGQTAKTNQDYFMRVADLVARTTSDVQKQKILEAAGLPTTRAWVEYMSLGSKGIEAATKATITFNDSAEQNLIKKAKAFDDAWNSATTNMTNYFKSAVVSIIGFLSSIEPPSWMAKVGQAMAQSIPVLNAAVAAYQAAKGILTDNNAKNFADRFGEFDTPGNASNLRASLIQKTAGDKRQPKTQNELLVENQQAQQRISILGDLATVTEQVKQKELELAAAGLQGIGVNEKRAAQIVNATRAQAEMNRVQQQAAIGIFNVNDAQKAANDTLQMWIDKGLVNKNNAQEMAAAQLVLSRNIKQTADAAAVAAAPLQQLKQLELDASNLTKVLDTGLTSALSSLVGPMQDIINHTTSIGDGFRNMGIIVLKAIQEMIIKMLIIAPIAKGLRAIFAGFGLGGSFGSSPADNLAAGIAPLARGGAFSYGGVHAFASGGMFTNKLFNQPTPFLFAGGSKFGLMGEAGPEAVMPLRRGPNGSLGVQMFGGNRTTTNDNMVISYAPQITLGGTATQDDVQMLRKELANDRKRFKSETAKAIQDLRKRNGAV